MTRIAILDPFSGVAGDMLLGALIDLGVSEEWLKALPAVLGLDGVSVRVSRVARGDIACVKVDFDIPPQPHGRHLRHIRAIVDAAPAPEEVRAQAMAVFEAITEAEAAIHGSTVEKVHLHEVGAVDAILDVVGVVWGFHLLGVVRVHCASVALGDGFVDAAHGRLAVPAPATLRLLEGREVHVGPAGSGELTTPTGAALVRVLSTSDAVGTCRVIRGGYGAGTRDPKGRANALRVILADRSTSGEAESLALVSADIDDMPGEYLADLAETLRTRGALDVTLLQTLMKKGRPGVRIEVLATEGDASRFEDILLSESTTIGVRRSIVQRRALPRATHMVEVFGHVVSVKTVELPGGGQRSKAEFEDVVRVARLSGRSTGQVLEAIASLS